MGRRRGKGSESPRVDDVHLLHRASGVRLDLLEPPFRPSGHRMYGVDVPGYKGQFRPFPNKFVTGSPKKIRTL